MSDDFCLQARFRKCGCGLSPELLSGTGRLISAPALQFKGTGWYAADYVKGGSIEANSKPADSKSDNKPGSKLAESKPAETKSESKPSTD